ncbi:SDR family oxidoreductase [Erythrobacter sp. SCSIO 43205]|uniref:SDR family oxidoreductase n=1 Tax=Erythrobacter sp. SCSIO 43205 TaxID=2779361 RepID=UPI001CA93012|nr:SDR family oxidoreductase [Erythrobacter sp. SCSIO 43205]UAB77425.1 SDR family oxidoreductase [Erythrobacter sp. SCSIO 43205]
MTKPAVLITGSATRLGAEIARGFGKAGWHVVIHHLTSDDEAEALQSELPSAETVCCDLADHDAAVRLIKGLCARLPEFRCLINSASIFQYDNAREIEPDKYQQAMRINALTPALMTQHFLASARSAATRCAIQVTDMKLENTNPDFFSYTMSKHALASTIRMFAKDAGDQARIYGIAPGAILPSHDQSEDETDTSHKMNLLERKTGADEIVDAALFLSTGALKSGSTLFVDSGQHLLDQPRDVIYLAREEA